MRPNIEVTSDLTFVMPKYVFDVRCHVTSMLGVMLPLGGTKNAQDADVQEVFGKNMLGVG